jgi:hypothetical protein
MKVLRCEISSEDEFADFTVPSHGQYRITFKEGDALSNPPDPRAILCLRLNVAGRNNLVWLT